MQRGILAIVLASLAPAVANADTIESAFENTILVTTADGAQIKYFFEPDGAVAIAMPDGARIAGAWSVDGDRLCMTTEDSEPTCVPYLDDKAVGDVWTQPGAESETVTVSILPGRD